MAILIKQNRLLNYLLFSFSNNSSRGTIFTVVPSFNVLENSGEDIFGCGYPEIGESGVANVLVASEWRQLIGNGAYIFKPNTEFTQQWYNEMIQLLDEKLEDLRDYYVKNNGNGLSLS